MTFDEAMDKLHPSADMILPHLWVGDLRAGQIARTLPDFDVLNVREEYITQIGGIRVAEHDGLIYTDGLDQAAQWIEEIWLFGDARARGITQRHTLIHCMAGRDRSPACVVWYLHTKRGMTLNDAYLWVRVHRECNDRRDWFNYPGVANGQGT